MEGIHIHTGSDFIELDIFERVANLIFNIADEFENISSIDFGSGFKVKYKEGDMQTNIAEVAKSFSKLFNDYCAQRNKKLTLRFELGKYLVSEAGAFLTQANIIKQTTAYTFICVNSGFNHLI